MISSNYNSLSMERKKSLLLLIITIIPNSTLSIQKVSSTTGNGNNHDIRRQWINYAKDTNVSNGCRGSIRREFARVRNRIWLHFTWRKLELQRTWASLKMRAVLFETCSFRCFRRRPRRKDVTRIRRLFHRKKRKKNLLKILGEKAYNRWWRRSLLLLLRSLYLRIMDWYYL